MVYNGFHEYSSVHKEWYAAHIKIGQIHRGRMIKNMHKDAIRGDWNLLSTAQKERYKASARLPETERIPRNGAEPPLPQRQPGAAAASPSEQSKTSLAPESAENLEREEHTVPEQVFPLGSTEETLPGLGQLLLPTTTASKSKRSDAADEQYPISTYMKSDSDKASSKLALLEAYASGTNKRQREADSGLGRDPKRLKVESDQGSDMLELLETFLSQPERQLDPDPSATLESAFDTDDESAESPLVNIAQRSCKSTSEISNLVDYDDSYAADTEPSSEEPSKLQRSLSGSGSEDSNGDTSYKYLYATSESPSPATELLNEQQLLKRSNSSTPDHIAIPNIEVEEGGNPADVFRWVMQWAENADGDQWGVLDQPTPPFDGEEDVGHIDHHRIHQPSARSAPMLLFTPFMSDNEYFFGDATSQSVFPESDSSSLAYEYGVEDDNNNHDLGRTESQSASQGPDSETLTSEYAMNDLYNETLLAHGLPRFGIASRSDEADFYDSGSGNTDDPVAFQNHAVEDDGQYTALQTNSEADHTSLHVDSEDDLSYTPDEPVWLD